MYSFELRCLKGLNDGKALFFVVSSPDIHTPGGLVLRTSTASEMKNRKDRYPQLILCEDTNQSLYGQLLCGLVQRDAIEKSWQGIIKKLWPRTKYVQAIITRSIAQYVPMLEFYSGGLPIVSPAYVSSEACFGINLKPLCSPCHVSYTFIPNMAYYEFVPIDNHQDPNCTNRKDDHLKDHIVDLANVKIGQHYELLVTTFTGLYRYRMGDILLVTGFHNVTPQFKFVQRRNVVLSIDTSRKQLQLQCISLNHLASFFWITVAMQIHPLFLATMYSFGSFN